MALLLCCTCGLSCPWDTNPGSEQPWAAPRTGNPWQSLLGKATKLRFSWNNQQHKDRIFALLLHLRIIQIGEALQEFLDTPFSHSFCCGISSSALSLWPNLIYFLGYISLVFLVTWVGTHQNHLFYEFFCLPLM